VSPDSPQRSAKCGEYFLAGEQHQNDRSYPYILPTGLALAHVVSIVEMNGDKVENSIKQKLLRGKFFSLAPEKTDQARLLAFNSGGVTAQQPLQRVGQYEVAEVKNLAGSLADIVARALVSTPGSSLFFREPYLNKDQVPSDFLKIGSGLFKKIESSGWEVFNLAKEVAYFTVSWNFLSIISAVTSLHPCFDELMEQVNFIAVNAYDGESYMFWVEDDFAIR
jgi:hypothetical protein